MMVADTIRITRKSGGRVVVEVKCKYGIWYLVWEGRFADMVLDAEILKVLPGCFYEQPAQ